MKPKAGAESVDGVAESGAADPMDAAPGQSDMSQILGLLKTVVGDLKEVKLTINGMIDENADRDLKLETLTASVSAVGATGGGGSSSAALEAKVAELTAKLEEVAERPSPQPNLEEQKRIYAKQLLNASNAEKSQHVRTVWHPLVDAAKRQALGHGPLPLTRTVRGDKEFREAKERGYLGSLKEAAVAAHKAGDYPSLAMALEGLHGAASAGAREQVAHIAPKVQVVTAA